jgi:hypothetical protein
MEEFFAQLGNLLQGLLALADSGFDGVNQVLGLIIAAVFALFLMGAWRGLWGAAFGAWWSTPWSRRSGPCWMAEPSCCPT